MAETTPILISLGESLKQNAPVLAQPYEITLEMLASRTQ